MFSNIISVSFILYSLPYKPQIELIIIKSH